jgi:hypothetical protein
MDNKYNESDIKEIKEGLSKFYGSLVQITKIANCSRPNLTNILSGRHYNENIITICKVVLEGLEKQQTEKLNHAKDFAKQLL